MTTLFRAAAALTLLLLLAAAARAQAAGEPRRQELDGAEHYVRILEERVQKANGQPVELGSEEKEALKRVKALKEKYPEHEKVKELFERTRKAILGSKGEAMTITPEMLAYRESEKKLHKEFAAEAETQWTAFREKVLAEKGAIAAPFPAPSFRDVDFEELRGRTVILDAFEYPRNQFYDLGREFVHVGAGAKGWYFVEIGNREWLGIYEAIKRYRRLVNPRLPEDGKWTLVGMITGVELMVPDAGKKKTGPAQWGWRVVPRAVYVPGETFAAFAPELESGGRFAGEARLDEIKAPLYTVREVPADVTPERLVEIFATAIKEKNFDLYLDCIDPARKETPTALSLVRYHWDWHQRRFAEFYCHVTVVPGRSRVRVLKGYEPGKSDEDFFLTEEEKQKLRERSGPLVEEAVIWTKAWDERGVQYGSEKPHFLRRYGKKRWHISSYADPY